VSRTKETLQRTSDGAQEQSAAGETVRSRRILLGSAIILIVGTLVYLNSFRGVFIFDDSGAILNNPTIRQLWPIWNVLRTPQVMTSSGRPVVNLTLAVNWAVSGLRTWSYHGFNLAVHLAAALLLFGVVRRTLLAERLRARFERAALPVALAVALIWVIHPLNTAAVTYIVQRAESLMGMLYLLTLYCAIRGFPACPAGAGQVGRSSARRWWYAAAVASCVLGMATKEVMVTAPLLVLLYDRVFCAKSWRELFHRRWALYAALAASWAVLAGLMIMNPRTQTVGFNLEYVKPLDYAKTQFAVIVHYLHLAVVPWPLCLDYGWPVATKVGDFVPHAVVIVLLLAETVIALLRRPALGFLGVWFFLILAPTSSFVPIADLCFEHRMYLPLAAVVTLVVVGAYLAVGLIFRVSRYRWIAGVVVTAAVAAVLGLLTVRRNMDYYSDYAMWREVVRRRPGNARAHHNFGNSLLKIHSKLDEAERHFTRAIELYPDYALAHNGLGVVYLRRGQLDKAKRQFKRGIQLAPGFATIHNNLGKVYASRGQWDKATPCFIRAIRLDPGNADWHYAMFRMLAGAGRDRQALKHLRIFLLAKPGHVGARNDLAWLLATSPDGGVRDGRRAVEIAQGVCGEAETFGNLATLAAAYAEAGDFAQAVRTQQRAVELTERAGSDQADKYRRRLELYRSGRPLRQLPRD